jgi:hypothetical protein
MTYPAPLLPDLFIGWQTVGDQNNLPIYVFRTGDICRAARSEAQEMGYLMDTLGPPSAGSWASRPGQRSCHDHSTAGRGAGFCRWWER